MKNLNVASSVPLIFMASAGLACEAFDDPTPRGSGGSLIYPSGGTPGYSTGGYASGGYQYWPSGGSSSGDEDGDQLFSADEVASGLDPKKPDTDGDGCLDFFDSAFPDCNAASLTRFPNSCENLASPSISYFTEPPSLSGKLVRAEVAWFSYVSDGLGGAPGAEPWVASKIDGEPVVLLDGRVREFSLPELSPPSTDEVANAGDASIRRYALRVLDYTSGEELYRWAVYRGVGGNCLVP